MRTLAILLFVGGFIVAPMAFASDTFTPADPIWIVAVVVAAAGATVGVLLRKRRGEVTITNVVWRVAPPTGIAIGILYITIVLGPHPPAGESSYYGISLFAYSGIGLVWGSLCAGGAVIAAKIDTRVWAVAIGSLVGAITAGLLTLPMLNGAPIFIAFGGIVTLAICVAVALGDPGGPPWRRTPPDA